MSGIEPILKEPFHMNCHIEVFAKLKTRVELLILYGFSKMLHFRGFERIKRGVLAV